MHVRTLKNSEHDMTCIALESIVIALINYYEQQYVFHFHMLAAICATRSAMYELCSALAARH